MYVRMCKGNLAKNNIILYVKLTSAVIWKTKYRYYISHKYSRNHLDLVYVRLLLLVLYVVWCEPYHYVILELTMTKKPSSVQGILKDGSSCV